MQVVVGKARTWTASAFSVNQYRAQMDQNVRDNSAVEFQCGMQGSYRVPMETCRDTLELYLSQRVLRRVRVIRLCQHVSACFAFQPLLKPAYYVRSFVRTARVSIETCIKLGRSATATLTLRWACVEWVYLRRTKGQLRCTGEARALGSDDSVLMRVSTGSWWEVPRSY